MKKRHFRITPVSVFFIGAAAAFLSLLFSILPYGGRFVTRGDFIEQQLPFILEARRILRGGLNSYSFSTFLGAPALGTYAFYTLGSPFVWPLALLPEALIPYGISVMAVLKHAVCMLCSFLFLRKLLKDDRLAFTGSILYTFSSFTVVNLQFYHFTEVIAFFPLILLGIEDSMGEHPHRGALALACGLNALTNYYFMFSSALLAALYFCFRFFSRDWRERRSLRSVVRVVFECGFGCGLAGILLVPALFTMLTVTRNGGADASLLTQHYSLPVLLERLRVLLMPVESNVVHAFYGTAPSWCSTAAYLPVIGFAGIPVFFSMKKQHGWLKGLLVLLFALSAVPFLCGLFVLESNVLYTRWWYGLVLMLTAATLYALRGRPLPDFRGTWILSALGCCLTVLLLTVPFLLPESFLSAFTDGLSGRIASFLLGMKTGAYAGDVFRVVFLGLSLLGAILFFLAIFSRKVRAVFPVVLLAFSCLCYCAYDRMGQKYILSGGTEAGNGVYTLEEIADPTLSVLSVEKPGTYTRIDYGKKLRNYGLLRGQSSLTCFNSLRSSTIGKFISMAGFGYDESTTVAPPDGSPAVRALLSVCEYHCLDGEQPPEGFVYDREENGFAVYRNENAVPMGFLQTCWTGTHDQKMDADSTAQVLLAAVTLDGEQAERYSSLLTKLDVSAIPGWKESAAKLMKNACSSFITRTDGFDAEIDAASSGIVVFTIPYDKGFSVAVDGQEQDVIPCDVSFMGVWVQEGQHTIEFTYRTRGLVPGILMTAGSAAVLFFYLLLFRRKNPAKPAERNLTK